MVGKRCKRTEGLGASHGPEWLSGLEIARVMQVCRSSGMFGERRRVPRIPDVHVADFRHRGKDEHGRERRTGESIAAFFFFLETNRIASAVRRSPLLVSHHI
jgi:hypothetical protein